MTNSIRLPLAAAAVALIAAAAVPATAADYLIKYGHPGPVGWDSDDHISGEFLKSFLETRSNGRIEVQIFPGSQLGSFQEMVEQVDAGTLEIAHTALPGLVGFMPEAQVIELPYIIADDLVAECLMDGSFFEDLRKTLLERSDVNLIGIGNTGRFRSFFTANRLVKSAEDLGGIKMRVVNAQLPVHMMQLLGANPTPIAWGELYTSLATGVVEGTGNAVTDIMPNRMNEVLKYATLDEHAYLWGFMAVSQTFLESLPDDLRNLTVSGIRQMMEVQTMFNKGAEGRQTAAFVEGGGEVYVPTAEEMETFRAIRDPMRDWYIGEYGEEWYDRFMGAVTECEADVESQLAVWSSR